MLIILSPAKTLDVNISDCIISDSSSLVFEKETKELVSILQKYSKEELANLMKMSDKLAEVNYKRYRDFYNKDTSEYTALLAFKGEAYKGINVDDFDNEDLLYSQKVLRILSGLYGVIKPLDKIKEYRLEMGTKLNNSCGKDLYSFWESKITDEIIKAVEDSVGDKILINLASKEYSSVLNVDNIRKNIKIVDILFLENKDGNYKVVGTYSKKARGLMTRYILKNKVNRIDDIKKFNIEGYIFNDKLSNDNEIIFTRDR